MQRPPQACIVHRSRVFPLHTTRLMQTRYLPMMAETSKILEGVFAISKPPSLSSAQVIRDLQQHFKKSKLFAPLLDETHRRYAEQDRHQAKRRRRDNDSVFKMGHGGTLDPMATGVLIIGLGRGTKHLQDFLGCTKQYDTVVLFGKSTDTYDICGKIVGEAPFEQVTQDKVSEQLALFKGNIKQVPPIYSALKINGMKAYEYARSGKELPRELESRDMQVEECSMVKYYEGGTHDFRWPTAEAPEEEKAAVKKLIQSTAPTVSSDSMATKGSATFAAAATTTSAPTDSTAPAENEDVTSGTSPDQALQHEIPSTETTGESNSKEDGPEKPTTATTENTIAEPTSTLSEEAALKATPDPKSNHLAPTTKAALHTHETPTLSSTPASSPAARVSLTVSSGFYVRSFAHDLGRALSSYGIMAELVRSRQGDYVIPSLSAQHPDLTPTITYEDLEAGEDVWGPKIQGTLEKWLSANPLPGGTDEHGNVRPDDRDRDDRKYSRNYHGRGRHGGGGGGGGGWRGRGKGAGKGNWRGGNKRDRDD